MNVLKADPWKSALIYSQSGSLHTALFRNGSGGQLALQFDASVKGLAGWLFRMDETRWSTSDNGSSTTLSTDIFGEVADNFIPALRTTFSGVMKSVWGTSDNLSSATASIADQIADKIDDITSLKNRAALESRP